jgi:hypothetical protein
VSCWAPLFAPSLWRLRGAYDLSTPVIPNKAITAVTCWSRNTDPRCHAAGRPTTRCVCVRTLALRGRPPCAARLVLSDGPRAQQLAPAARSRQPQQSRKLSSILASAEHAVCCHYCACLQVRRPIAD